MTPLIELGQKWYFFSQSEYFTVVRMNKDIYFEKEKLVEKIKLVTLTNLKGAIIERLPEVFNDNNCKIIKDNDFIINEPDMFSRLGKVE